MPAPARAIRDVSRAVSLIVFLALVLGGGLGLGMLANPGEWYARLEKPAFTPPDWLFPPVWTVLYVMIAVAGWRTWRRDPLGLAITLWWMQLALNFMWSPMFFVAHQIGLALIIMLLLLGVVLGFIGEVWRRDRIAAWLFIPYAAWLAFATMLNGSILSMG